MIHTSQDALKRELPLLSCLSQAHRFYLLALQTLGNKDDHFEATKFSLRTYYTISLGYVT